MSHTYIRKIIQQIKQISNQSVSIYNQLGEYMDTFLKKLLCEFRKAYSTQHAICKLL